MTFRDRVAVCLLLAVTGLMFGGMIRFRVPNNPNSGYRGIRFGSEKDWHRGGYGGVHQHVDSASIVPFSQLVSVRGAGDDENLKTDFVVPACLEWPNVVHIVFSGFRCVGENHFPYVGVGRWGASAIVEEVRIFVLAILAEWNKQSVGENSIRGIGSKVFDDRRVPYRGLHFIVHRDSTEIQPSELGVKAYPRVLIYSQFLSSERVSVLSGLRSIISGVGGIPQWFQLQAVYDGLCESSYCQSQCQSNQDCISIPFIAKEDYKLFDLSKQFSKISDEQTHPRWQWFPVGVAGLAAFLYGLWLVMKGLFLRGMILALVGFVCGQFGFVHWLN